MLNILVTGSKGQVGSELQELAASYEYNFYFTDRDSLDITDKESIAAFVKENRVDVIINAAAYTAVDKAEEDQTNADNVNHLSTKYLAEISKEQNINKIMNKISQNLTIDNDDSKNKSVVQSIDGKVMISGKVDDIMYQVMAIMDAIEEDFGFDMIKERQRYERRKQ